MIQSASLCECVIYHWTQTHSVYIFPESWNNLDLMTMTFGILFFHFFNLVFLCTASANRLLFSYFFILYYPVMLYGFNSMCGCVIFLQHPFGLSVYCRGIFSSFSFILILSEWEYTGVKNSNNNTMWWSFCCWWREIFFIIIMCCSCVFFLSSYLSLFLAH